MADRLDLQGGLDSGLPQILADCGVRWKCGLTEPTDVQLGG